MVEDLRMLAAPYDEAVIERHAREELRVDAKHLREIAAVRLGEVEGDDDRGLAEEAGVDAEVEF